MDVTTVKNDKPFKYDEGGLHVTRGSTWAAPGCHEGCGVLMYTDDEGRLVKVEGDPDNPFNSGRLCARCLTMPEVVSSPNRLLRPMLRDKADRGKDRWRPVSWDEAYDLVEQRFNSYKESHGAESVVFLAGTARDISPYLTRLSYSFGSPNTGPALSGMACYGPRVWGCMAMTGSFWVGDYSQQFADRYDNPDWKVPECIAIWGNNPIVSSSDGLYGPWVLDCMQRGSKLIVIDPRITWLGSRAEIMLQIRPGTDAALAMAMGNVIVEEGLYDHDFVGKWAFGFESYVEAISPYTPERAAEICGVDAEDIRRAARLYANADGGLIQWGVALEHRADCLHANQAIASLMILTGNIDNPGGMIAPPTLLMYIAGWGMELMSEEQMAKRLGPERSLFLRAPGMVAVGTDSVIETMETGDPYPIKAAWIQACNLLTCMGVDPERTLNAFRTLDFVVMVDIFQTPTSMAIADLLLPACMYPERVGLRCGDGVQRMETINKAMEPAGEAKPDIEINLEIGKRFNPEAWPWNSVEELLSSILAETGYTFEEAQKAAPGYLPFEYRKYEKGKLRPDGQEGFPTPSGKLELYSNIYEAIGLDPLPKYTEVTPGPVSTPELYEEFPLILITGARRWNTFHAENRENPRLRRLHAEPTVQIHPDVASKLNLHEGEWVWLEGPKGMTGKVERCKRVVEITPIVRPDVVSTDHAWWHPEADPENLYDMMDLNVNKLIPWGWSETGCGANYKNLLCRIVKMTEE